MSTLTLSTMPRPSSRASSRASIRSPSPMDDQVSIRSQMSSLKHEIRQKQAQFNNLETTLLRGPRPLPPPSPTDMGTGIPTIAFQRKASGESLGIPVHHDMNGHSLNGEDIKEGVPSSFGDRSLSVSPGRRSSSPTRSWSRIPVSSVGLARALAEDTAAPNRSTEKDGSSSIDVSLASINPGDTSNALANVLNTPTKLPSPNTNRRSLAAGGTTKVLADLQAGVMNARNALENTKTQLRLSQRTVSQLTRQVEDMRDGRERLRLENESLNNVVARKERLLQEILERARKAEAEAQQLKTQLKSETTQTKKALKEMETQLSESTALSQHSEREYVVLRDSMRELTSAWQKDMAELKTSFKAREEEWKKQIDETGLKYRSLMKLVQATQAERARLENLRQEKQKLDAEFEKGFRDELNTFSGSLANIRIDQDNSSKSVENVKDELDRLHRMIKIRTQSSQSSLLMSSPKT